MSKKKSYITPEEKALFRQSVKATQPIRQDKILAHTEKPPKKIIREPFTKNHSPYLSANSHSLLEKLSPEDWQTAEDYIHFARDGISHRIRNRLKRGLVPIEARLDLHRLTGDEMLDTISQFLQEAISKRQRCVLVVHGKGGIHPDKPPILKNLLNQWLRQQPEVLAFSSATRHDGGTGALYLLLKSRTHLK